MHHRVSLSVGGQGLYEITHRVREVVESSAVSVGLVTLFLRHTSASLLIQENADPRVLDDLQRWMRDAVPEDSRLYTHVEEGPDDMPAHIRTALTATSLSVPLIDGQLALGTWQGIFLWEHRHHRGQRELIVTITS